MRDIFDDLADEWLEIVNPEKRTFVRSSATSIADAMEYCAKKLAVNRTPPAGKKALWICPSCGVAYIVERMVEAK